jgi:hypothetical protein
MCLLYSFWATLSTDPKDFFMLVFERDPTLNDSLLEFFGFLTGIAYSNAIPTSGSADV